MFLRASKVSSYLRAGQLATGLSTKQSIGAISAAVIALTMAMASTAQAGVVEIKNNMLHVDGESQPQLFGAEVQYFRLRGGTGRNIPRDKVLELWNKALDHLVEMGANAVSFYIPWDFHEYAPGKFDFDGTVDEDGDGLPDYPARDLKTFLRLIDEHGIRHILVRPGPFINAEWGFLGFGAVPQWFHDKYPESHMHNAKGQRTPLFSYDDPDFLRETKVWLQNLYTQVLVDWIGPGKPVSFLQLDNETNYQWGSIFKNDYGPRALKSYRAGLKASYKTISAVNAAHHRTWKNWGEIKAPTQAGLNVNEDQDWYRFHDQSIHTFLQTLRKMWEEIGVKEPNILFTLAESYNAAENGLLPNFQLRNDPGQTGLMTVNLYPKLSGAAFSPLLNTPFKVDHDVKAAGSANHFYFGQKQDWLMGPEVQTGWFGGTEVSPEARTQTYLSALGHGMKAMFVYYFNEGDNWQSEWSFTQVKRDYDELKQDPRYATLGTAQLPDTFWHELDEKFANRVFAGWDTRAIFERGIATTTELYFDAPLDGNGDPRPHFDVLKDIGAKVIEPYGRFLSSAVEITDPVCFVKDVASQVPSPIKNLDSNTMNAEWSAGLIGYLLQAGINPEILHLGLTPESEFSNCKLIIYQDNGVANPALVALLKKHLANGGSVLNFIGDDVFKALVPNAGVANCEPIKNGSLEVTAQKCRTSGAGFVYQAQTPLYRDFNSDDYAGMQDVPERMRFLTAILNDLKIVPKLHVIGGDRVVAFARTGPDGKKILVTVKSGRGDSSRCHVSWSGADPKKAYGVSRLLEGTFSEVSGQILATTGFICGLKPQGADMFFIEPVGSPPTR